MAARDPSSVALFPWILVLMLLALYFPDSGLGMAYSLDMRILGVVDCGLRWRAVLYYLHNIHLAVMADSIVRLVTGGRTSAGAEAKAVSMVVDHQCRNQIQNCCSAAEKPFVLD